MNHQTIRWKLGVLAAVAMTMLFLYPQVAVWVDRGRDWHGSYAIIQADELAYSAYINTLIDGRPRRSDPYTGRDDLPNAPQPESLFSIQFIPAYAIALPARVLGLSASTAFIALMIIAAFASSLAIFWLIASVAGDDRVAATGVLVVLCFGTLAGSQGTGPLLVGADIWYASVPFLRRYQPSATFPLFFVLCALVWRTLTKERALAALRAAITAGVVFGVLVYSYFYLWTAAAAWLACLALLWLVARPAGWRRDVKWFSIIGGVAVCSLLPYFVLLSRRGETTDSVQVLVISRLPDLLRAPELIGAIVLAVLALGAWRGVIEWRSKAVLFTASLALMPFVVFNQQIISGRSLQPFHYELFIANYVVLVALVVAIALLWRERAGDLVRKIPRRALVYIALASLMWGAIEIAFYAKALGRHSRQFDEAMPVLIRLAELARSDSTLDIPRGEHKQYPVVISTEIAVATSLPTVAPQAVLWSPYHVTFPGITEDESKERFYQYLYYSGIDEQRLAQALKEDFFFRVAVFGFERARPELTVEPEPITVDEIETEVRRYQEYAASFTLERASHPMLSHAITPAENEPDWSNLDRWYERDGGESWGKFKLYRVQLRSWNSSPAQHSDDTIAKAQHSTR